MPDKMSQENPAVARFLEPGLSSRQRPSSPEDPRSYYSVARRLVEETPNSILADQYYNPVNPQAH